MEVLTFDLAKWYEDSEGFWFAVRTKDRALAAQTAIKAKGEPWEAKLSQKRKKRSLDANAYMWVLLGKLSEVLRIPARELYRESIKDVGGNFELVCVQDKAVETIRSGWEHNGIGWITEALPSKLEGCTNVLLYSGSSTYDTKQMSRLLDIVITECKEQGIETMTPDELALMKARWADAQENKSP